MATLSYQEFLDLVREWVRSKAPEIAGLWPQKGGWESWAQADIAGFILSRNSTYDLLREEHVFISPRKKADFLLNHFSPPSDMVVIELKCQSLLNNDRFVPGLEEDISKLIKDLKPEYSGAALLVVGLYFTEHAKIPDYFHKEIFGDGEIGLCWAVDLNS